MLLILGCGCRYEPVSLRGRAELCKWMMLLRSAFPTSAAGRPHLRSAVKHNHYKAAKGHLSPGWVLLLLCQVVLSAPYSRGWSRGSERLKSLPLEKDNQWIKWNSTWVICVGVRLCSQTWCHLQTGGEQAQQAASEVQSLKNAWWDVTRVPISTRLCCITYTEFWKLPHCLLWELKIEQPGSSWIMFSIALATQDGKL